MILNIKQGDFVIRLENSFDNVDTSTKFWQVVKSKNLYLPKGQFALVDNYLVNGLYEIEDEVSNFITLKEFLTFQQRAGIYLDANPNDKNIRRNSAAISEFLYVYSSSAEKSLQKEFVVDFRKQRVINQSIHLQICPAVPKNLIKDKREYENTLLLPGDEGYIKIPDIMSIETIKKNLRNQKKVLEYLQKYNLLETESPKLIFFDRKR